MNTCTNSLRKLMSVGFLISLQAIFFDTRVMMPSLHSAEAPISLDKNLRSIEPVPPRPTPSRFSSFRRGSLLESSGSSESSFIPFQESSRNSSVSSRPNSSISDGEKSTSSTYLPPIVKPTKESLLSRKALQAEEKAKQEEQKALQAIKRATMESQEALQAKERAKQEEQKALQAIKRANRAHNEATESAEDLRRYQKQIARQKPLEPKQPFSLLPSREERLKRNDAILRRQSRSFYGSENNSDESLAELHEKLIEDNA